MFGNFIFMSLIHILVFMALSKQLMQGTVCIQKTLFSVLELLIRKWWAESIMKRNKWNILLCRWALQYLRNLPIVLSLQPYSICRIYTHSFSSTSLWLHLLSNLAIVSTLHEPCYCSLHIPYSNINNLFFHRWHKAVIVMPPKEYMSVASNFVYSS